MIVGNGFDIAAGNKTAYAEFIEYLKENDMKSPLVDFFISAYEQKFFSNDEWNGFECLLCQYLDFLNSLFEDKFVEKTFFEKKGGNKNQKEYRITIKDISDQVDDWRQLFYLKNPLQGKLNFYFEESLDKPTLKPFTGLDKNSKVKKLVGIVDVFFSPPNLTDKSVLNYLLIELDERLNDFEKQLKEYIKSATEENEGEIINVLCDSEIETAISFNYSHTIKKYYTIQDDSIAFVNGDVESNIILGVEPEMLSAESIKENPSFRRFFKKYRRIKKCCNQNYNKKIIDVLSNDSIIAIFGHSLDLSDKSILEPIFKKKYKRYDVYCYKKTEEYIKKLDKLIGLDYFDELRNEGRINFIITE